MDQKDGEESIGEAMEEAEGSTPDGPQFDMALVVFLGGALGTLLRWALGGVAVPVGGFHPGTFLANMLACSGYAFLASYLAERTDLSKRRRDYSSRALGMGLCGGLSTMSTMVVEVLEDMMAGHVPGSLIYLLCSFILGLALATLMAKFGRAAAGHRSGSLPPGGSPSGTSGESSSGLSGGIQAATRGGET